jgi:predicted RNase H-like HicB family nuclease
MDSAEYLVVLEPADDGSYSAYVPDLPGCVAFGDTEDEAKQLNHEAIGLHLESLRSHHQAVPEPRATVCKVRG